MVPWEREEVRSKWARINQGLPEFCRNVRFTLCKSSKIDLRQFVCIVIALCNSLVSSFTNYKFKAFLKRINKDQVSIYISELSIKIKSDLEWAQISRGRFCWWAPPAGLSSPQSQTVALLQKPLADSCHISRHKKPKWYRVSLLLSIYQSNPGTGYKLFKLKANNKQYIQLEKWYTTHNFTILPNVIANKDPIYYIDKSFRTFQMITLTAIQV